MKRKVLASLLVVAVVVGLVGASTFALFSDPETASENTMTAGTLDLKINDANDPTGIIVVSNMAPGVESGEYNLNFSNIGSIDGSVSLTFAITGEADGNTTFPDGLGTNDVNANQFAANVYVTSAQYYPDGGPWRDVLPDWKAYGDAWKGNNDGSLSLKEMVDAGTWDMTETLTAGGIAYVKVKFTLNSGVGNAYQGEGTEFSITATLNQ